MDLPTISSTSLITIPLEPLTPSSFAPFGTVISSPLSSSSSKPTHPSSSQDTIPTQIPPPCYSTQPTPVFANQNTALKTSPISPLINDYPRSSATKPSSKPLMSLFTCFPRPTSSVTKGTLPIRILERHPYTTQTFSPLALPAAETDTVFIVVVAPTLPSLPSSPSFQHKVERPPDLANMKAFLARGDQAITYGPGTWHAPMIVLGRRRVVFVVTQFANGVAGDDCQEVLVGGVEIRLDGLPGGVIDMGVDGNGDVRGGDRGGTMSKGLWAKVRAKL